jgi:hypothetical protein
MKQPITISHKLHPARQQGNSLAQMAIIKYCIASNRKLVIGTSNVDALYERIKFEYPEAKLSKHDGYVLVERGEE